MSNLNWNSRYTTTGKRDRGYRDRGNRDEGSDEEVRSAFRRTGNDTHIHSVAGVVPSAFRAGMGSQLHQAHHASMHNRNQHLLTQCQKLNVEKEELRRDLNRCKSDAYALENKIGPLEQRIGNLEQAIRVLNDEKRQLEEENDDLRGTIRQLNADPDLINRLQHEIRELHIQLAVGHRGQVNNALENLHF